MILAGIWAEEMILQGVDVAKKARAATVLAPRQAKGLHSASRPIVEVRRLIAERRQRGKAIQERLRQP